MKNIYYLFRSFGAIAVVTCLFFVTPVKSDTTEVSGQIVEGKWSLFGSPYVVTGDIRIAGLTIDPGVKILFAGNYEFKVEGVIEAIGTEQSEIIFTTKAGVASWKGILFQNSSPGSYLKWCIVEKANTSGIRMFASSPNLFSCIIRNNTSVSVGGGIYMAESFSKLYNCTISNNTATPSGGGIYISNTITDTIRLIDCIIENNLATESPGVNAYGGGVSIVSGKVDFAGCQFLKNRVITTTASNIVFYAIGGGISTGGTSSIRNCKIIDNKIIASTSNGSADAHAYGGGVYVYGGITTIQNSIIAYDTIITSGGDNRNPRGAGVQSNGGQTIIVNSTIAQNSIEGLHRSAGSIMVINSIIFFNNNNGVQTVGSATITYSDVQVVPVYPGTGNINFSPNLDTCLRIVSGSLCIDAGNDSVKYRDVCFPPSRGGIRNDMGADGGPGACNWSGGCYPTKLTIKIKLSALMEGLYNAATNEMSRAQVERVYLRNASPPHAVVEPAAGTINTDGISTEFIFNAAPTGTYYIVAKNFNCIETWSKSGGESLVRNNSVYNYDFTSSISQAFGSNQILKGSEYCIYSGDVDQGGSIDGTDLALVDNDAFNSSLGYLATDLNGDFFVDGSDLLIVDNNVFRFVTVVRP